MNRFGLATLFALMLSSSAAAQQAAAPPPIPHPIDGYLVTRAENNCLECHDKPRDIGKAKKKGMNVPAPVSHYGGKLEGKPEIATGFYNCTSCHAKK